MRIDRWNCGEMRRYHHPSRAILVTGYNPRTGRKLASIIPASTPCGVVVPLERMRAAEILREWRAARA